METLVDHFRIFQILELQLLALTSNDVPAPPPPSVPHPPRPAFAAMAGQPAWGGGTSRAMVGDDGVAGEDEDEQPAPPPAGPRCRRHVSVCGHREMCV